MVNPNWTFGFANMETLKGGTADDTFVVETSGRVNMTVYGWQGDDTLDYSKLSSKVVVVLAKDKTGGDASGPIHFLDIDKFVGSKNSDNTLRGPDEPTTWHVTGPSLASLIWSTPTGPSASRTWRP